MSRDYTGIELPPKPKESSLMRLLILLTLLLLSIYPTNTLAAKSDKDKAADSIFKSIKFRNLGPGVTSGRISDLAVNPDKPSHYFAATASGGLWKTTNGGVTWSTPFDNEASYSIGVVTMDPNNSNVIWVGTGENNSQRSVAYGDGVYKSSDGGSSWTNVGLKNSGHIGEILIDPRNSDIVYASAMGPLWSNGGDRGVYKSTDGGKTWTNILSISQYTGVSDMAFDPTNADVIYASAYQRRRHVWTLINGGPESAIYKSTDAGLTWNKITSGLPEVDLGRIGLAVAPSQPNTVYAIVEAADGNSGFYRSVDAGASWHKQSSYVASSPQYYQEIVVDPNYPDRVYSLDTYLNVTDDGGKTFRRVGNTARHVDDHALWINPDDSDHLLVGGDGGLYQSWDRGKNWSFKDNMSLTQFYRVGIDNDFPFYNVYGGTQDNATLGAPHRTTNSSGIRNSDWTYTQFGDGFKPAIDPTDPNIVYSQYQYGGLARYDKASGERMQIQPVSPDPEVAQRFNWNSPLIISPHNHKRLYYASQQVFRSDDRGESWTAVSGDLSRNLDRNKLKVMDRVWGVDTVAKNNSTSFYGAVIALNESTIQEGLLYAGTDDGLMHVTTNGGDDWQKLKWPRKVPDNSYVSDLEPSLHNAKTVFATFDNHKKGDFKPYIYRSDNQGKDWKNITGDMPERGTVHTIAQDHVNKDLLFAGTEFGVFFTQNGGKNWIQLKSGIPTIAIRDMEIQRRESDLVLASFGRGFYVLDDYSPLRVPAAEVKSATATLFPVRRAFQFIVHHPMGLPGKSMLGDDFFTADNPEYGAVFSYYVSEDFTSLKKQRQKREKALRKDNKDVFYPSWEELKEEDLEQEPSLIFTVRDDEGNLVRRIKAPAKQGFNRINWDLRYPGFDPIQEDGARDSGPLAVPGEYQVSMSKVVNGVETAYAGVQRFMVEALDNRTFRSEDRDADLAFDLKAGQLYKAISGAGRFLNELEKRLQHVEVAITETLKVDQALLFKSHDLKRELAEIKMLLNGNSVISSRSEPTPTSVQGYISYLRWSRSENTHGVTPDHRLRYQRASDGYSRVYEAMSKLADEVDSLEAKLQAADSPWLPGTRPSDGQ
jgi:photosystem II stability/assembly factor-like uncharacterized protein